MPQKRTEKIEIGKKAPKIQIGQNLSPVFPMVEGQSVSPGRVDAGNNQAGPILPGEGASGPVASGDLSGDSSLVQTGPGQSGLVMQSGIGGSGVISGSAGIVGGGAGGAGDASLQFPGYLQKMENKISGVWAPPPVSFQGEPANVTIQFNVMKNGHVERESIKVEKSSGNPFFDQAAMRAVYGADPFPPFPEFLSEDRLSIHFNFTVLENS
jgi:TonB family protein